MMQTVIAVAHGEPDVDEVITCEVLTYPLQAASGSTQLGELIAASAPGAGEVVDPMSMRMRLDRLAELGGHTDDVSSDQLRGMQRASGNSNRTVYGEDYSSVVGHVLAFDADVDASGAVNWSTATPHPTTQPSSLPAGESYLRADGFVVDTDAIGAGRHRLAMTADGRFAPHTQLDTPVTGVLPPDGRDTSGMVDEDMVVAVTRSDSGGLTCACVPVSVLARTGGVMPDLAGNGYDARSCDFEAFVDAAGGTGQILTGADGSKTWVGVVAGPHMDPTPGYGGNAAPVVAALRPAADPYTVIPSFDTQGRLQALPAGQQGPSLSSMATAAPVHVAPAAATEASTATKPRPGARALAGMSGRARALAGTHGPQVAAAVRETVRDPALIARLRIAGELAVGAAVMTPGGASAKLSAGLSSVAKNPEIKSLAADAGRSVVSKSRSSSPTY